MSRIFLTFLRMGVVSGYVVLVVLLVRWLLRRFPKTYSYLLWSIVFLRLVCPVGIKSSFSLIPDVLYVQSDAEEGGNVIVDRKAAGVLVHHGVSISAQSVEDFFEGKPDDRTILADKDNTKTGAAQGNHPQPGQDSDAGGTKGSVQAGKDGSLGGTVGSILTGQNNDGRLTGEDLPAGQDDGTGNENGVKSPGQWVLSLLGGIWIFGILVFWFVWLYTVHRFRKRLLGAVRVEEGVYETSQVAASFVDGIFHPVIYLARGLSGAAREYVLCHERVHIRRKDPLIKALALFLVSIYWFHPLIWLAFSKMCEDMEMSCDEWVVERMGTEIKKEYSSTLLQMAQGADKISLLAAFGGNEVKSRVKNILSYRKPKTWLAVLLLLLVVMVGVGLGLNPGDADAKTSGGSHHGRGEADAGREGGENAGSLDGKDGQGDADSPDGKDGQGNADSPDGKDGYSGTDPIAKYASVLDQYHTALNEQWDAARLTQEGFSILARYCYDGNAAENVGYSFLDVDGDGKMELLIGAVTGDAFVQGQIFELYTLKDGEPVQVFSGRERSRYYLCQKEDGNYAIANEGSSGASNSEWSYYTLQDGTLSGELVIIYDDMPDAESPWSMASGTDIEAGRFETVTDETAKRMQDVYGSEYIEPEYSPFARLNRLEMGGDSYGAVEPVLGEQWKRSGKALENQLNLILSQREVWELVDIDLSPGEGWYTVTDLDRNGRLELIAAYRQGTGIYTHFYIYEVSADGESLVRCTRTLLEEYDSQPDIIIGQVPVYLDTVTGKQHYIFQDTIRDGVAYLYESQFALSFANGHLTEKVLASRETEYKDSTPFITYHSGELDEVRVTDETEYESVADRAFPNFVKGEARIDWFPAQEDLGGEELYQKLEEAYLGFLPM
ncbi:MAG: M56 family metallopeptidase [Lachnospiraceae bacterium]|nr:M56 family metallopeptidase [Lachnospiraceae bacterium]